MGIGSSLEFEPAQPRKWALVRITGRGLNEWAGWSSARPNRGHSAPSEDPGGFGVITPADVVQRSSCPGGLPSLYVTPPYLLFQHTRGGPLPAALPDSRRD
jgi:hypothetical protein